MPLKFAVNKSLFTFESIYPSISFFDIRLGFAISFFCPLFKVKNNLRLGTPTGTLSANSLEEVSVQAGGFSAEYGFANSAIVNAITKTGGSELNIFGEFITDQFLSQSSEQLGTFSYGYNVSNLAISGPIPGFDNRVRFFTSIERDKFKDATPSVGIHPVLIEDKQPF